MHGLGTNGGEYGGPFVVAACESDAVGAIGYVGDMGVLAVFCWVGINRRRGYHSRDRWARFGGDGKTSYGGDDVEGGGMVVRDDDGFVRYGARSHGTRMVAVSMDMIMS